MFKCSEYEEKTTQSTHCTPCKIQEALGSMQLGQQDSQDQPSYMHSDIHTRLKKIVHYIAN